MELDGFAKEFLICSQSTRYSRRDFRESWWVVLVTRASPRQPSVAHFFIYLFLYNIIMIRINLLTRVILFANKDKFEIFKNFLGIKVFLPHLDLTAIYKSICNGEVKCHFYL